MDPEPPLQLFSNFHAIRRSCAWPASIGLDRIVMARQFAGGIVWRLMRRRADGAGAWQADREQLRREHSGGGARYSTSSPRATSSGMPVSSAGFDPQIHRSLDDLARLPTLRKSELVSDQAATPPYGTNLSQPMSAFTRLHQTSGTTTGQPLRWLDTPRSWAARWNRGDAFIG